MDQDRKTEKVLHDLLGVNFFVLENEIPFNTEIIELLEKDQVAEAIKLMVISDIKAYSILKRFNDYGIRLENMQFMYFTEVIELAAPFNYLRYDYDNILFANDLSLDQKTERILELLKIPK